VLAKRLDSQTAFEIVSIDIADIDVGANIGSYTVLASSVVGTRVLAIEPDPNTMSHLKRNLTANQVNHLVQTEEVAIGASLGTVQFTIGQDTTNQVSRDPSVASRSVKLTTLDLLLAQEEPVFIKLDVEGYEPEALAGARKTLEMANLAALATECDDHSIIDLLVAHGFQRVWYDPFKRKLHLEPIGVQSNALFVRDFDACQARLMSARAVHVLNREI
jgi:FkbM family methyltransferase